MDEMGHIPTDRLTINQLRWLAARGWHETDVGCLRALGLGASTVTRWRTQPHFADAEKSIWVGDIKRSQEMMSRLRDQAVLVLQKSMESRDPRTRRAAAVDVLDRTGFARGVEVSHGVSDALAALLSKAKAKVKEVEEDDG